MIDRIPILRIRDLLLISIQADLHDILVEQLQSDILKELERKPRPSKTWAACMKRIFEIDPLVCPKCTGRMHIKSFIINGSEIERLAKDIGIIPWRAPPAFKPAQTDIAA